MLGSVIATSCLTQQRTLPINGYWWLTWVSHQLPWGLGPVSVYSVSSIFQPRATLSISQKKCHPERPSTVRGGSTKRAWFQEAVLERLRSSSRSTGRRSWALLSLFHYIIPLLGTYFSGVDFHVVFMCPPYLGQFHSEATVLEPLSCRCRSLVDQLQVRKAKLTRCHANLPFGKGS